MRAEADGSAAEEEAHAGGEYCQAAAWVDGLTSQGMSVADAVGWVSGEAALAVGSASVTGVVRAIGVFEVTHHRWRREHGGLMSDRSTRMRALDVENQRLRKGVADLTLDTLILAQAARGTSRPAWPSRLC